MFTARTQRWISVFGAFDFLCPYNAVNATSKSLAGKLYNLSVSLITGAALFRAI